MAIVLGRLAISDPDAFPEPLGEAFGRVGATPTAGARAGLTTSAQLSTWADTAAERSRVRRQLRSLLQNLPLCRRGLYLAWSEDPDQDGWYVPGATSLQLDGKDLDPAVWLFGLDLALVGRPRTHRRAVRARLLDRRLATTPRDHLNRVYSDDFAAMDALALTWLPSDVSDLVVTSVASAPTTAARAGYGNAQVKAVIGATDLAVASFDQPAGARNLGDVVIYDRAGELTGPNTGPDAAWEEVYGPDFPLTAGDVPVLDNAVTRVRWDDDDTPGLIVERWTGSAWSEEGKAIIRRLGDSTAFLDTLVRADVAEWAPERAVLRLVMRDADDAYSRETVYVTLQRGWTGPRIEVYPSPIAAGTPAGAGVAFYAAAAVGEDSALKVDAAGAGAVVYTDGAFTPGAVGASTFTGENWVTLLRGGAGAAVTLAVLQEAATARVESDSAAYGAARNGICVQAAAAGYISAHVGLHPFAGDTQMEAESMTLASGTTSTDDSGAGASNTNAATASRTSANTDHVTRAAWLASNLGVYRVFARVRTAAATLNIRAVTTATTGATKTTTSTSYVWLDLGEIRADGNALSIQAWRSTSGSFYVDRIAAVLIEDRTAAGALYNGARDLGEEVLYDSRAFPTVVARA